MKVISKMTPVVSVGWGKEYSLASETRGISLMPCVRAPPSEKRTGEQSQISWSYYPQVVMTNDIVRLVITT